VKGCYDHVEKVLEALELPYTTLVAGQVSGVPLSPRQILVINCPGEVGPEAIRKIRMFVEEGGTLFTTDWALKNVLEPAFPGIVEYNGRATADDVVRVVVRIGRIGFWRGDGRGDDPLWWLEGSSYPIRVLAPEKVEVLIASQELKAKYGESPVAIRFRAGKGEVFHMISHYYLQRAELRTDRHKMKAEEYIGGKGVAAQIFEKGELDDLQVGDVESAASSSMFFAKIVASKKQGMADKKSKSDGNR
jgi:hypothetical protein